MTFRIAFVLALLVPSLAIADERQPSLRLPTAVYAAGAGADVASTLLTSHWGGREANPAVAWLEPKVGTAGMLVAGEAIDATAVILLSKWIGKKHPSIAKWALYGAAGARFYIASGNLRKGNEYRRYVRAGGTVVDGRGVTPVR